MQKIKYVLLVSLLFVVGCSQPTVIRNGKVIPYEEAALQDYNAIQGFLSYKQDARVLAAIDGFEREFPHSRYLPKVLFIKGEVYYGQGNYDAASTTFDRAALLADSEEFRNHALYNEAVSLFHTTRYQASTDVLRLIDRGSLSPTLSTQVSALEKLLAPYVKNATPVIEEGSSIEVSRNTIGVILPLTGTYSVSGKAAYQGIKLAVEQIQNSGGPQLSLAILDDSGSVGAAKSAVDELLQKDHVIAVVGPLLGATSEAIISRAEELGVPILPLSQKEGLAAGKSYAFLNTMTNSLQSEELVKYAIERRGLKKFAILYPDDAYGIELAKFFRENVLAKGGEIVEEISYQPGATDFRNEMKKLAKLDDFTNRMDEWKEIKSQKEAELGREAKPDEVKLPPKVDFEALYIPDFPKTLGQIIPAWFAYGGGKDPNVQLLFLGSNGWNSTDLVRRAGKYVEGAIFVDSFFINNTDPNVQNFIQLYRNNFQKEPDLLAATGYDALSLLGYALKDRGIATRKELRDALKRIKMYPGVTGITSLSNDGKSTKQLYILTFRNGQIISALK